MTENEKRILETKIHTAVKARDSEALIALYQKSLPIGITPKLLEELQDYGFKFLELYRNACLHDFLEIVKSGEPIAVQELSALLPVSGELSSSIKRTIVDGESYIEQIAALECKQYLQTGSRLVDIG